MPDKHEALSRQDANASRALATTVLHEIGHQHVFRLSLPALLELEAQIAPLMNRGVSELSRMTATEWFAEHYAAYRRGLLNGEDRRAEREIVARIVRGNSR